jgi:RimJ/RimL family protein N-acetyltransferase
MIDFANLDVSREIQYKLNAYTELLFTWNKKINLVSKNINLEDELAWIRTVLASQNEKRCAICVGKSAKYIGNIQLTNIAANQAEFHIFIGDKSMHGLGIGSQATVLLLNYSKIFLGLNEIYLYVHKDNIPAINLYKNCGFLFFGYSTENRLKFICKL